MRRAHKILAAFDAGADGFPDVTANTPKPAITVESGSIKVRSGFFKPSGSVASLSGFTAFSLKDDVPTAVGVDEEVWALYTDIEKTRGELEHHYNAQRVVDKPGQFAFTEGNLGAAPYTTTATTISARRTRDVFTMSGIGATNSDLERIVSSHLDQCRR